MLFTGSKNIERSMRHCKWCKINTGINVTECEDHFLYNCKLTSVQRSKSIQKINTILGSTHTNIDFMQTLQLQDHTKSSNNTNCLKTRQHQDQANNPQCNADVNTIASNIVEQMVTVFLDQRKQYLKTVTATHPATAPPVSSENANNVYAVPSRGPWKLCIPVKKFETHPKF